MHRTLTFYDYRDIMGIPRERTKKRWRLNLEISYEFFGRNWTLLHGNDVKLMENMWDKQT